MEPNNLSEQQIEYLFQFVKKKFVPFYDLQVELVDHLATEIEQKLQDDPAISFEAALAQVYAGFGIFGFSKLVEARKSALSSRGRSLWWAKFKALFSWPGLAISVLSFWSVGLMIHLVGPLGTCLLGFTGVVIVSSSVLVRIQRLKRRFAVLNFSNLVFGILNGMMFQVLLHASLYEDWLLAHTNWAHGLVWLFVLAYISLVQVDKELRGEVYRLYPNS